jgi:hypothetical protein
MLPAVKTWIAGHRRWTAAIGAVVVAAGVTVAVVTGSDSGHHQSQTLPPTRARTYTQQQACLLTGERGLADPAAAPVWAGMRDASADTHAKVMYLAMAGEQTAAAAGPYLATLASRQCTVVLTVGPAPDGAVPAAGPKFPGTRFVAVGGKSGGSNVTVVPEGSAASTRDAVATALTDALRH